MLKVLGLIQALPIPPPSQQKQEDKIINKCCANEVK
jgi:hypothetical protein